MNLHEHKASGLEAIALVTRLLQRTRLQDPDGGIWEAADFQWWWRIPRQSDSIEQLFWLDDHGPVAAIYLSSWGSDRWQCDPIIVPTTPEIELSTLWERAMEQITAKSLVNVDVPVADNDAGSMALAKRYGFTAGDRDSTAWMNAVDRPDVGPIAPCFHITDRTERQDSRHPLADRNGDDVENRLRQCSLYNPSLDLAVETAEGEVAGYSLYWFDPVTKVGLVEPVRVGDDFQRRGLASAMLQEGIHRLAKAGAERIKVSFESEPAGRLYQSVGFKTTSTTTWYCATSD